MEIFKRWVTEGRNLGSLTSRCTKILDLYGEEIFGQAVLALVASGAHDVGTLAMTCETLRKQAHLAVPIAFNVGHLPDRDVLPHNLEVYDDVNNDT